MVGEDKKARDMFAVMLVDDLTLKYPDYDAVAAVKGTVEGDATHQHAELAYKHGLSSQGYEVFAVKHGECGFTCGFKFASHAKCVAMLLSHCCFAARQAV